MAAVQYIGTIRPNTAPEASAPGRRETSGGLVRDRRAMAEQVLEWCRRIGYRRSLRVLPDRMLSAMGLSRMQAAEEAAKPFWQP